MRNPDRNALEMPKATHGERRRNEEMNSQENVLGNLRRMGNLPGTHQEVSGNPSGGQRELIRRSAGTHQEVSGNPSGGQRFKLGFNDIFTVSM